jgi:hypothetical protein
MLRQAHHSAPRSLPPSRSFQRRHRDPRCRQLRVRSCIAAGQQRSRVPEIQRSRGSEIQRPRGPEVQRSRGPEVQRSRGPEVQRFRDPEVQRFRGPFSRRKTAQLVQKGDKWAWFHIISIIHADRNLAALQLVLLASGVPSFRDIPSVSRPRRTGHRGSSSLRSVLYVWLQSSLLGPKLGGR